MAMISAPAMADLIASIYEAALDDAQWEGLIGRFARVLGAQGGLLYSVDFSNASSSLGDQGNELSASSGMDVSFLKSYTDYYTFINVWQKNEDVLKEGVAVTSSMLFPDEHLPNTEFGNDWLRPQNLFYALGGVIARNGHHAAKASLVRSRSDGPFLAEDVAIWQIIVDHMRRALSLRRRVIQDRSAVHSGLACLDLLTQGVILISAQGGIVYINTKAERYLIERKGLFLTHHHQLRASKAGLDKKFQTMVMGCILTGTNRSLRAAGGAIRLEGEEGTLCAFITPLPANRLHIDLSRCVAAVFLSDPSEQPVGLPDRVRVLYGLTAAEARLASALIAGESVKEYASDSGLSVHTVRTHLKAVAGKIGVRRQSDILRVVLTGPAMLGQIEC